MSKPLFFNNADYRKCLKFLIEQNNYRSFLSLNCIFSTFFSRSIYYIIMVFGTYFRYYRSKNELSLLRSRIRMKGNFYIL